MDDNSSVFKVVAIMVAIVLFVVIIFITGLLNAMFGIFMATSGC